MQTLLEQLSALVPLAAAATEGPWSVTMESCDCEPGCNCQPWVHAIRMAGPIPESRLAGTGYEFDREVGDMSEETAAFIAAARNLLTPANLTALTAALAAPVAAEAGRNPLVAFLLSSDTGMSSKAIAARYAGVTPCNGYFSHPYDSSDFGRCHRLLQLVPAIDINVMRGASPVWDRLVEYWPALTAAYEQQADWKGFQALIEPLTRS